MIVNPETASQIRNHEKFDILVARRRTLTWVLSLTAVGLYVGFAALMAFKGDFLASPVSSSSTITWGLVFAFLAIVLTIALTGIYVTRMARIVDQATEDIYDEIGQ